MSSPQPPAEIRRSLARIGLLIDQRELRNHRRRRFWRRDLALLEALAGALERLPGERTEADWLATLSEGAERLGREVVGATPAPEAPGEPERGRHRPLADTDDGDGNTQESGRQAAARAARVPPRGRSTVDSAERSGAGSAGGRQQRGILIADALQTYPAFLAADQEAAIGAELERAAREGREPLEIAPLPLLAAREALIAKLKRHDVLLVSGATGSGKSLLTPLFALEAGLGQRGRIVQTQPRRVAARQIAARLAEMTGSELGGLIGCHTRVDRDHGPATRVKVCTDGILLQELRGDPLLKRYDLVILDEAHERSLNIDLLMGLLQRVRAQRPELKIVLSSATLEVERFASYWDLTAEQQIAVPGRLYPVEQVYVDAPDEATADERDDADILGGQVADAVEKIARERLPGDVLVFLPRFKEIQAAAKALERKRLPDLTVLTMHGRQDPAENQRCFRPLVERKVILATNIAETSITLPGIRTVIDSGLVNQTDFDPKTGITRLVPRPVSQASADQRAGRAGRLASGTCLRLWSAEAHAQRPEFTEPEIRRSNLAALVLRMADMDIADIPRFPFISRPTSEQLMEARRVLIDLGAIQAGGPITALGRTMAGLPLEPHIARMLLAAEDYGCAEQALTIAACLSVDRSLFRHPMPGQPGAEGRRQKINQIRRKLAGSGGSDVDVMLGLADGYRDLRWKERRRFCEDHVASLVALEEIRSIRGDLARALGRREGGGRDRDSGRGKGKSKGRGPALDPGQLRSALGKTLLSGLVHHVAVRAGGHAYVGAGDVELYIHPGSVLFDRKPELIVSGRVEAGEHRTFARHVVPLQLPWLEQVAGHLMSTLQRNVRYDRGRGRVLAEEDVYFRQLTVAEGREVDLFDRDPDEAMRILISDGLLAGQMRIEPSFHPENLQVLEEARRLADRLGDPELAPDEERLLLRYAERLEGCRSQRDVERRLKGGGLQRMTLELDDLLGPDELARARALYPAEVTLGGARCPVRYVYNPWKGRRTVTLELPLTALGDVDQASLEGAIPGLLAEQLDCWTAACREHGVLSADQTLPPVDGHRPLAEHVAAALGEPPPEAVVTAVQASIAEQQLLPWVEVRDARREVICSEAGFAAIQAAHVRQQRAEAWDAARARHESQPSEQVGCVPALLDGLLEEVAVWCPPGSAEAERAWVGVDRDARGWWRRLFAEPAEAEDRTRAALAGYVRLRLALKPGALAGLAPAVSEKLDQRFYEATGLPKLAERLQRSLEWMACGGTLDRAALQAGDVLEQVAAAGQRARALADELPVALGRILDALGRLQRRRAGGAAADPEAAAALADRATSQLKQVGDAPPEALLALAEALR